MHDASKAAFVALTLAVSLHSAGWPRQALAQTAPSPENALKSIRVTEGVELQLFAAEPMVEQPVSMSFDDRGRLWVLQYRQYPIPNGLKPTAVDEYLRTRYDRVPEPPPHGPKGNDRIAILEDVDGDGRADRSKTFLEGLNLASGFALGYDGVFVAQPPYLLFYPDRNHDDIPDGDPEVLLKGFGMEDAHAFANSLTWGPDGWLYGAQGSTVTAIIRGIEFQQGIWRYHVATKRFELFAEGGGNTWGIDFDREGQLFAGGNTTEPLCHHVQGAYYIKGFGKHGPLHNPFALGYFRPVKHNGFLGSALTGGCVIYQGGLFPERLDNRCIYPNLRANAMRVARLDRDGSTFTTNFQEDFALSSDVWFRPVDCLVGPDGALYAADWCDVNISHTSPKDRSQWYPPSRSDGRIWRFTPTGTNPRPQAPLGLEKLPSAELVKLLTHANAWYSREARRILGERRDASTLETLKAMALAASDEKASLEGLWATYVSGGFDELLAVRLLEHPSPAVRMWTVRLIGDECEAPAALHAIFLKLAGEEANPNVRSQLACTAKRLPGEQALPIIERMLQRDADAADPHLPLLLWWAVEDKAVSDRSQVLAMLQAPAAWQRPLIRDTIVERLARRYAGEASAEGWAACTELVKLAPESGLRNRLIGAIDAQLAVSRMKTPPAELSQILDAMLSEPHVAPAVLRLALRFELPAALPKALDAVANADIAEADRIGLLETLGAAPHPECVARLLALLAKDVSPAVQTAALAALQPYEDGTIGDTLLQRYSQWPPQLKPRVSGLLVSRANWSQTLVDSVREGKLAAAEVGLDQVRQMLLHNRPELTAQIEKLWGKLQPSTSREKQGRIKAVGQILAKGQGDAARGKALMMKHCGVCHQLFGEGNKIGPDLTGVDRKNLSVLLSNVVDPTSVIRPEFVAYTAQTDDGRVINGLLADSTPETVTLLDSRNTRTTLPRDKIEALQPMTISLMPERILDPLTDQELRDLFAYLRSDQRP
ncbi:MAG TPA: PVC-type heme-binding CxxCH protein [Pirellulales bacterium]|nr:PVC-type heme-binding CxxCH protein [Pirellulales bacterium]